jgi:hypothetical protein
MWKEQFIYTYLNMPSEVGAKLKHETFTITRKEILMLDELN